MALMKTGRALCGTETSFEAHYKQIGLKVPVLDKNQVPIVYSPANNIRFWGLEKLHPFDSCKFEKVLAALPLASKGLRHIEPAGPASNALLELVHDPSYLKALDSSSLKVAQVTELSPLVFLPSFLTRARVVVPMKTMAAGTVLATALAARYGWSIHLGGGMHHAHRTDGGGWCMFADWLLALRVLREASGGKIQRALYIDLDVHQGDGVTRDKRDTGDRDLITLDVYNADIYPRNKEAQKGIDIAEEIHCGCEDAEYLQRVERALCRARALGPFHIVLYNAGTDILNGDPLGRTAVSAAGIQRRDELVWTFAREMDCPIVQCLSGGYSQGNAAVVADSLRNLIGKFQLLET